MPGYLSLVLHAHLPFVRHPEHEKFLEENWLFEAITETYLPLLEVLAGWRRDGMAARLTLTLTPTLCAMLLDPLLQDRYARHLDGLIELAEKEIHRTHWEPGCQPLAERYHRRFLALREAWRALRIGGAVSVVHWRSDIPTPRGPPLAIRPTPEQCRLWMTAAGFESVRRIDLHSCCPYHFGVIGYRTR